MELNDKTSEPMLYKIYGRQNFKNKNTKNSKAIKRTYNKVAKNKLVVFTTFCF